MAVHLQHVATVVPSASYPQATAGDVMRRWIGGDRRTDLLLNRIYARSAIDRRQSVLEDFLDDDGRRAARSALVPVHDDGAAPAARVPPSRPGGGFFVDDAGGFRSPTTAERNARYREEAAPLFVEAGRHALAAVDDVDVNDVTHLITVSCTGFYAPGPDLDVVHGLGLRPTTERYHVGFMGCYAAFPALRMAHAFCRADPDAVVLVVATELCSLHLQPDRAVDPIVAASVFADGAAAAIVSSRPPSGRALRMERFVDGLAPEGASDMAWTIGDHGFEMVLSSYVPKVVGEKAHAALDPLLEGSGVSIENVSRWAVHPGGRAILDRLEEGLVLPPEALAASRSVLRRYGNMSSATVLFVLAELMADPGPIDEPLVAMAFGPGLTVASGLFTSV